MQQIAKAIIIIISSVICFGLVIRIYKISERKKHYLVTDTAGQAYITNYVLEKSGCIFFIDEVNIQHKVCGSYSIEKL